MTEPETDPREEEFEQGHAQAEAGDSAAQCVLGIMCADGRGVPQDDADAVRWFRLAADQGHTDAQFFLGIMYTLDQGVPKDHV